MTLDRGGELALIAIRNGSRTVLVLDSSRPFPVQSGQPTGHADSHYFVNSFRFCSAGSAATAIIT
jgi:hypothetical protein